MIGIETRRCDTHMQLTQDKNLSFLELFYNLSYLRV